MTKEKKNSYEKITLDNGLRVVLSHLPAFRSVTAIVLCGAGSRYEKHETNGISHFLEHMFFKGTNKRPVASDISHALDEVGADYNAFTGKETTGYHIKSASQHLPLLLDMLSDMLWNSKFDEAEIEKEKGVIIEEINLYEDTPMRRVAEIYEQLLWDKQPLGWDIGGRKEVIRGVTRKNFTNYIAERYAPNNIVLSIAGDYARDEVVRDLNRFFGKEKRREVPGFLPALDHQTKPALRVDYKKTDQAHLVLGVRGLKLGHEDRYNAALLATILGGGMSSRLFLNVREKRGLAYYVRADHEAYLDTGTFCASAGVDLKRIDDAIRVILEEFAKIANEKVEEKELKKAKEYLKGKVILSWEDSRNVAAGFGSDELLEGKIRTMDMFLEAIEAVTVDDIERVAHFFFDQKKLNLAVIGPFKEFQRFEKLLKF
ncbi:insulinase family protein [Candidatus Curtissbacteria bacterium]|nr:insulinase family protein [Candidatus Curtissbacteria bacterium]